MARNRWNAHDYSYLRYVSPAQAFEQSYEGLPYGNRREWPATVNRTLIETFAGREILRARDAVEAFTATVDPAKKSGLSPEFLASRAGNQLGWGVRFGLLRMKEVDGERVWTMPDREPWFVLDASGKKARQVRGLSDGAQAALNRRLAAQEKAKATIRAKAAAENAPRIEAALNTVLLHDPGFVIPATPWPFPDDQWDVYLAPLALPVPLVEVLPIVREAHEGMEPKRQVRWRGVVERAAFRAKGEAEQRQRDVEHAAWLAARAAAAAADDAALEGL